MSRSWYYFIGYAFSICAVPLPVHNTPLQLARLATFIYEWINVKIFLNDHLKYSKLPLTDPPPILLTPLTLTTPLTSPLTPPLLLTTPPSLPYSSPLLATRPSTVHSNPPYPSLHHFHLTHHSHSTHSTHHTSLPLTTPPQPTTPPNPTTPAQSSPLPTTPRHHSLSPNP